MADDFEQAARLTEAMLGELILAGVNPQSGGQAEDWHLLLGYSDDDDKDTDTKADSGTHSPAEISSKRSSLIRSRANSLLDFYGTMLPSLERLSSNEIDRAKADLKPFEENIALLAKQAASDKREADKVLDNLRKGEADDRNTPNAIYELLNLAANRNSIRLKNIEKIIKKWERIKNPTNEVKNWISTLKQSADKCTKETRVLKEQALFQTAAAIELDPSAQGVLFLHRHGLIKHMGPPVCGHVSQIRV